MENIELEIRELEADTQQKVSDSISKIEVALAEWDGAKKKPKQLAKRIEYLRKSHQLLSAWAMESLKGKRDFPSTVDRLRRFTELCQKIDSKGLD